MVRGQPENHKVLNMWHKSPHGIAAVAIIVKVLHFPFMQASVRLSALAFGSFLGAAFLLTPLAGWGRPVPKRQGNFEKLSLAIIGAFPKELQCGYSLQCEIARKEFDKKAVKPISRFIQKNNPVTVTVLVTDIWQTGGSNPLLKERWNMTGYFVTDLGKFTDAGYIDDDYRKKYEEKCLISVGPTKVGYTSILIKALNVKIPDFAGVDKGKFVTISDTHIQPYTTVEQYNRWSGKTSYYLPESKDSKYIPRIAFAAKKGTVTPAKEISLQLQCK